MSKKGFVIACLEKGYSDGIYANKDDVDRMLGWYRAAYPSYTFELFEAARTHRQTKNILQSFDFWVEDSKAADKYDMEH